MDGRDGWRPAQTAEGARLDEPGRAWHRWGPYLSERAWGTVREDYSADGSAWDSFPHDHARSRVYRWNEDGLLGICDEHQRLCFALALWNGQDPILKERFFGLTGSEGNHGEDVKEYYYHLDSTPTHSYLRALYKYPQAAFPYARLVEENRRRTKEDDEFELLDTGVFDGDRYWDVFVEYAKAARHDILIRVTAVNRGPDPATLHLLPTLWYRNTWAWGLYPGRPQIEEEYPDLDEAAGGTANEGATQPKQAGAPAALYVKAEHHSLGEYQLACEGADDLLFAENETNVQRLFGVPNPTPYVKDAFHAYVIHGDRAAVNPQRAGTKAAAYYARTAASGEAITLRLRLRRTRRADQVARGARASEAVPPEQGTPAAPASQGALAHPDGEANPNGRAASQTGGASEATEMVGVGRPHETQAAPRRHGRFEDFEAVFAKRQQEADEFYAALQPPALTDDERQVQRQAFAGLLWSKQFYHYDVDRWLKGDPAQPPPPASRLWGRNRQWRHLNSADVLAMPDTWEYPWFAAWDLAFHCVTFATIDSRFAKDQLLLLLREWYQHPNAQVPAYEWSFGDVNPPVLAWAAWRVYTIEQRRRGAGDRDFLERVFHKLMLNFTWWVNRKDVEGNNIFEGGFLGLDNIGVFDRSATLPTGGSIEQSDGTSWMAMYCLNLMTIAIELARGDAVYEDIASKFFEHFLCIAAAMNNIGNDNVPLWNEEDEFFYDVLHLPDGSSLPLRVRSLVGLIPLLAVETIEPDVLDGMPAFKARLEWYLEHRPDLAALVSSWHEPGVGDRRLLALVRGHRLKCLLRRALDPHEFLSDYGIRSVSKYHAAHPYNLCVDGVDHTVEYWPAESRSGLFGGNSNWRGPIWFPINYVLIEALQKFHYYFGDDFLVEHPTGSGRYVTIEQITDDLSRRLIRLFVRDERGRRPFNGAHDLLQRDPCWRDLLLFHEYFHGDTGKGLGASHQTGWTALVAKLIEQQGEYAARTRSTPAQQPAAIPGEAAMPAETQARP